MNPADGYIEKVQQLPSFLVKLWAILNDKNYDSVICWDATGESFSIADSYKFCRSVLPQYFKHSNLNSFVRQLNLYGFRKVSPVAKSGTDGFDNLHFANAFFLKGRHDLLCRIKRNAVSTKDRGRTESSKSQVPKMVSLAEDDLICLLQELKLVRERQTSMKNTITSLTRDNILLWQEMASLRDKQQKQQQNVGKLVQYLMSLVQPHQKRMGAHGTQRIVQLDEFEVSRSQNQSNSNEQPNSLLALQRGQLKQNVDPDILYGIQREITESTTNRALSFNAETALLEGLQLRQRAIDEGAPYLDKSLNGEELLYPNSIERPLRTDRLRLTNGIQLKRPFQRSVLSPSPPSTSLFSKRPLYTKPERLRSPSPSFLDHSYDISLPSSSGFTISERNSNEMDDEEMQYLIQEGNYRLSDVYNDGSENVQFTWPAEEQLDEEFADFLGDDTILSPCMDNDKILSEQTVSTDSKRGL